MPQATCSNLGIFDGEKYLPEPDCVECVKDLIRFLRRDDENHCVRRALGSLGVLKSDLVPILRDHSNHRELFDVTLRLLVNLTNPELLLFKEELPEDKVTRNYYLQIQAQRQGYKAAFIDAALWKVLTKTLGSLLKKDWDERLEDDKLIIERILILIRNVLQVPTNVRREGRTMDDVSLHDQVLWVLHQSGMQDLLLYIASSEAEAAYCLHILETISLMFREQDPASLASADFARSAAEKTADEEALARARRQEAEKAKARSKMAATSRHSRFGGTFVLKNVKSITDRELIVQKPLQNLQDLNFDEKKRALKKSKNKMTPSDDTGTHRSTLPVRIFLKEFCVEFLHSAYNQLMGVVRDALNRQRAQQNDETYYLWCIRFFMQFNRHHQFLIELVSDTLNRQTFHFLQQQMDNYRDNLEMEKKNRPKYLMWGRRMHLCIRAYHELLNWLVAMENNKDERVKEAGRVLRASVFYESEYRELCLQQLSTFNPDKMSLGYLTDLVATTHVFIKLMEVMSKGKKMLVSKKKKVVKRTAGKKKGTRVGGDAGGREKLEDMWENVSSRISAILQGHLDSPLPEVVPFDAASDVPIDEQKVLCMRRIQGALKTSKAEEAVALTRAAREVWTEGEPFGAADAETEEEFMTLREILFADLGGELVDEQDGGEDQGEVGEEDNEYEEEEEEETKTVSVEQELDFKAFVNRFAIQRVVMPYGTLFSNYAKNSKETNYQIIKMFHRIAFDCSVPAILFQACIFRVFQQIWADLKTNKDDPSLREMAKFAKFILAKFLKASETNKKIFMELLFWKTSRDATEIIEGYGTQSATAKQKKAFWSEDDEERLREVFHTVMGMREGNQEGQREGDALDQIELTLSAENRSRRQIGNKLKELGLISKMEEVTRKPLKSSREWQEAESDKLRELVEEWRSSENPGARIYEQWKAASMPVRSKKALVERAVEMELVGDRADLGRKGASKRRRGQKPKEGEAGFLQRASDVDSALEDSSSGEEESGSDDDEDQADNSPSHSSAQSGSLLSTLEGLMEGEVTSLAWVADKFEEEAADRADDSEDAEDVPIVPLEESVQASLALPQVTSVLESVGLTKPGPGEQWWRIPSLLTAAQLRARATVLRRVGAGERGEEVVRDVDEDLLGAQRGLWAIQGVVEQRRKKKKKRGPNKWMPFRRPEEAGPAKSTPSKSAAQKDKSKKESSKKMKNKSFLESSDDENEETREKEQSRTRVEAAGGEGGGEIKSKEFLSSSDEDEAYNEKVDPENKENQPVKTVVSKSTSSVVIDKDRLRKMLEDSDFDGSDVSSEEDEPDEASAELEEKKKKAASRKKRSPKKKKTPPAKPVRKKKAALKAQKSTMSSDDEGDKKEEVEAERVAEDSSADEADAKKRPPRRKRNTTKKSSKSTDDDAETEEEKLLKRKKKMSLDSSEDEGVNDPTKPSQEVIKHDTTAASDVAADSTLNSDDDEDVQDKKKIGKKKKFSLDSSSEDEGVLDPKRASPLPEGKVVKRKGALDSSDEEEAERKRGKTKSLDSSDDDIALARGPFESTTVRKIAAIDEVVAKAVDNIEAETEGRRSRSGSRRSRSSSLGSLDSRMSSRAPSSRPNSRLDDTVDSRLNDTVDSRLDDTVDSRLDDTVDSRLGDSTLDDSRLDDSRLVDSQKVPSSPSQSQNIGDAKENDKAVLSQKRRTPSRRGRKVVSEEEISDIENKEPEVEKKNLSKKGKKEIDEGEDNIEEIEEDSLSSRTRKRGASSDAGSSPKKAKVASTGSRASSRKRAKTLQEKSDSD